MIISFYRLKVSRKFGKTKLYRIYGKSNVKRIIDLGLVLANEASRKVAGKLKISVRSKRRF